MIPRWLEMLFVAGATAGLMQQGLLGTNTYECFEVCGTQA